MSHPRHHRRAALGASALSVRRVVLGVVGTVVLTAGSTGTVFAAGSVTATCTVLDSGRAVVSGTVADLDLAPGAIGVFDWARPVFEAQVGYLYPVYDGPFELTTLEGVTVVPGTTLEVDLQRAGGTSVVSTNVTCVALVRSVSDLANELASSGVLSQGEANALLVKLDASTASAEKGNVTAAIRQLEAFKNEIEALLLSGRLTQAQRDDINAAADRQIAHLLT
jgi:hypothetical protein